jgi:hypothetical protein
MIEEGEKNAKWHRWERTALCVPAACAFPFFCDALSATLFAHALLRASTHAPARIAHAHSRLHARTHAHACADALFALLASPHPCVSSHRSAGSRALRFPDSADMNKVDAKLDNGVLIITCAPCARAAAHEPPHACAS